MNGLRFAALLLAGLLAGSELASRLIVHPALWRLSHDVQVKAEKAVYRRFGSIDPFLMVFGLASGQIWKSDEGVTEYGGGQRRRAGHRLAPGRWQKLPGTQISRRGDWHNGDLRRRRRCPLRPHPGRWREHRLRTRRPAIRDPRIRCRGPRGIDLVVQIPARLAAVPDHIYRPHIQHPPRRARS
jgi:hypothetical protein